MRVLSADLGNVLLHVEISCGGSLWSNSKCCGGNHNESIAELVQDSEPKLSQEIHHRVCRELLSGARQPQKPRQNLGNPTTAARQHSWEAADVHMRSSQTVPELDEYHETWGADDVDDKETTGWTSPTSRKFLPKTSAFCVGMHRKLGCQTMWRRTGFRPDAASGHYQRHLDSVLDFAERQSQFYKLQALESRTIHGAPSTLAWCQDRRCSMRKLKVMLGCRSGSVTRRRPTACPKITTSIWWLNGTPTKMCSQLLKTWMRCPTR